MFPFTEIIKGKVIISWIKVKKNRRYYQLKNYFCNNQT
jgi:hypothetical protein